jgi:hypothetical protein
MTSTQLELALPVTLALPGVSSRFSLADVHWVPGGQFGMSHVHWQSATPSLSACIC